MKDYGNQDCKIIDGVIYSADGKTLLKYAHSGKSSIFVIPDGVRCIGAEAFMYCPGLTEVIIPNSVQVISEGAFSHCEDLLKIVIPQSVIEIGEYAFWESENLTLYCEAESLPEGWSDVWHVCYDFCKELPVTWGYKSDL